MKLHRDPDITQETAWHLAMRIRESFECDSNGTFGGPVEVDETCIGGKREELKDPGRGAVGKTAVVGMKDRETNEVRAMVVKDTNRETLHPFIKDNVEEDAIVYTDDAAVYDTLPFDHEAVRHSVSEHVREMAHTNGVESLWATLKRAHKGTFHNEIERNMFAACVQDGLGTVRGTLTGIGAAGLACGISSPITEHVTSESGAVRFPLEPFAARC